MARKAAPISEAGSWEIIPAMPHILFLWPERRPQMPSEDTRKWQPMHGERRSVHAFLVCLVDPGLHHLLSISLASAYAIHACPQRM